MRRKRKPISTRWKLSLLAIAVFLLGMFSAYIADAKSMYPSCRALLGAHLDKPNIDCKLTSTGPRITVQFLNGQTQRPWYQLLDKLSTL